MRFYTQQHQFYCGIDLHARTRYLCILNRDGARLLHRTRSAGPDPFLKAIAPYREDVVVCGEWIFTWYGLADLCAREGSACVLGPALSRKAIHGGKATNATIAAQKIALLLRGGRLPQASVSPAEMRATRALRRRRLPRTRKRAALRAPSQHTNSQYTLPEMGKQLAAKANREGVGERFSAPAVPKSVDVALALMGSYDPLRSAVELPSVQTAQEPHAQALYRLQSVPGIGKIVRLVRRYAIHERSRFPRGQACVASCRLGKCAQESAAKRSGTSGATIGNADLTWAFSAAAGRCLRHNPVGQKSLTRLEKKQGMGKAFTVFAHPLARAVYDLLRRDTVCDMDQCLHGSGRGAGAPAAALGPSGAILITVRGNDASRRLRTPMRPEALCPAPARVIGRLLALLYEERKSLMVPVGCPSPDPEPHWRTQMGSPSLA